MPDRTNIRCFCDKVFFSKYLPLLLLSQFWFDLKLTSSLTYIYVVTLRVSLLSRKGEAFAITVILDDDKETTLRTSPFFLFILMFLFPVLSDPTAISYKFNAPNTQIRPTSRKILRVVDSRSRRHRYRISSRQYA